MADVLLWLWVAAFIFFVGYIVVGMIEKRRPPGWVWFAVPGLFALSVLIEVVR